jgi:hypothetical protein
MDPDKSYAGVGELLQQYINNSDQTAWEHIRAKIDYTYKNLDCALAPLETETGLSNEIKARTEKGQKLLFKPNLVQPASIDPQTHEPDKGSTTCTEWPFIAALMRWFHDKMGISYHRMALGEAATCMSAVAGMYSILTPDSKPVTTEAVIEGRCGEFYGGWGFYFARKYLAESLEPGRDDDPMHGYEESVAGKYIPPGHVTDKLMVYDLNRIFDDPSKGRDVKVPGGVNFKSIILHRVIVGGDPADPLDLEAYPGCILVNVPKFKVHAITLFTNVIKNLGIGLYPMQTARSGRFEWDYSTPHTLIPGMKSGIPHQVWVPEMEPDTGLPVRDASGTYVVEKTGGITATMIDIIKAVSSQETFMIHVVDGIETINVDHTGSGMGVKEPEGIVFAGLDPVATDLLCARYMFKNVTIDEAVKAGLDDGAGGSFPQRVPIPAVENNTIISRTGYDCPLSRDNTFKYAEEHRLGERRYHVVGRDAVTDRPLVSLEGHLGSVSDGTFSDLITNTLYFDAYKVPWDMQKTSLSYLAAADELAGSSRKKEFLEIFDENGDGIVTYEEFGRKGLFGPILVWGGNAVSQAGSERFGFLRGPFCAGTTRLKCTNAMWNPDGHDIMKDATYGAACFVAYRMSQLEFEAPDPFLPDLTWGNGKWPSYELAWYVYLGMNLYGDQFPNGIGFPSLYGFAFRYADLAQNKGGYAGQVWSQPDPESANRYISDMSNGNGNPLDFTLYIPAGYEYIGGSEAPNIEVTDDPARIFTASFDGGKETWTGMQPHA